MAKFLYVRVSSEVEGQQNLDRQMNDIEQYKKVYADRKSGKDTNRPQLQALLDRVEEGDEIDVWELSRLSRSLRDTLNLVEIITKEKKATLRFIKENMTFTPNREDALQKMYMSILSSVEEMNRQLIRERCQEGIEKARKRGVYRKAHPIKLNPVQFQQLKDDRSAGLTERELMNKYHISKPTLYRYLKK